MFKVCYNLNGVLYAAVLPSCVRETIASRIMRTHHVPWRQARQAAYDAIIHNLNSARSYAASR